MKMQLLMADYVGSTQDGKHVLAGLYADRRVVLFLPPETQTPAPPPGAPAMSFLVTLIDLPGGAHTCSAKVYDPDGAEYWTAGEIAFATPADGAANIVYNMAPFIVQKPGVYRVQLVVDGTVLEDNYAVQFLPLPGSPAAPQSN